MTNHPRALVTGGAGFLGSHLCERLLVDGWDVTCVDNLSTGRLENLAAVDASAAPGRLVFAHHDVREPMLALAADYQVVFHLACPASPAAYLSRPVETLETCSIGTANVFEVAASCGARLIAASTSEVYGDPLVTPQNESYWGNVNPTGPRSVYDEGKRYAEALLAAHTRTSDAPVVLARIFNTYGPRLAVDDGRVVSGMIAQALSDDPITVHGNGHQSRSFCYVSDTVDALVELGLRRDISGPVNIGNPREVRILDLAHLIKDLLGSQSPLTHLPAPVDDPQRRCPDITRIRAATGWRPTVDLEEGIRRTAEYLRSELPDRRGRRESLTGGDGERRAL